MTRILNLEMRGFKSFANKTDLVFGEKFNCVLGPNGSGKSNIMDAICFVLGKSSAKGLRAEKSANLIYNGGKSKSPAKSGMVSISFTNPGDVFGTGTDAIVLARSIRESGQSTYKINDKTMTRQQVLELLSRGRIDPDGYNIILQGDIVRLVEMNPVERRQIIEEVAGLSVYEDKKEKAMRELQRVDEKLTEAGIILAERETHLKELKKERDQALKFKRLDDDIKKNKATLIHRKIEDKEEAASEVLDKIKGLQEQAHAIRQEIAKREDEIRKAKQDIEKINKEVELKGEREQVLLHKEVEQLRVNIAVNKQRVQTLDQELQKITTRKEELNESVNEIVEKIKAMKTNIAAAKERSFTKEKQVSEIEVKLAAFRKKHKMEDASGIDSKVEELDKQADVIQEEIQKLREEQQNFLREKDRLEVKGQGHDEKIQKVLTIERENKTALDKLKQKKEEFKKATADLAKVIADDNAVMAQLNNAREEFYAKREELSKVQAEQARIRENIAGGVAIQKILAMRAKNKKILGTVSELGNVNSQYSLALGVAAGGRLQNIVVEDDKTAAECIQMLKQDKLGVATFLPLNKLKPKPVDVTLRKLQDAKGLAIDLIQFDSKLRSVFEHVFGSTIVVDDITTARRIGIGKARMVTMTGDLVETSGAMTGGHRVQKKGLGFMEKDVSSKADRLEAEMADKQAIISRLEQERKEYDEKIARLRELKHSLEGEIIKDEKSLHLDSEDLDASKNEKKKIAEELKHIDTELRRVQASVAVKNRELAKLKIDRQQMREQISEMRNPRVLAELNSFEDKKRELKDEIQAIQGELRNIESEIKNILEPEQEKTKNILKQHDKEISDFTREKKQVTDLLVTQERDLKEKEKAEKQFYEQFKELFQKRSRLSDSVSKLEANNTVQNQKVRDFELKENAISLENAKTKAELAGLHEEFKQYIGVEIFTTKPEDKIKKEISDFEKMLQDLGAVNMKALEIYEQVEKGYHELTEKRASLQTEREDVLIMINEIDTKKKELFTNTYEVLNKNFQDIFSRLSSKGQAYLELEYPKEPFNGGATIKVKLTGKKFLDIRSLSGGEKTLTALAFIFAVQEHAPASFYILDEVDAALDKRNSEKLSELVKAYSSKAQYIIISHNDNVITQAENLYGISMNQHGISKVTTLKI
ncbi:MAG: chromosome segregation protein SMC [Candidatus Woesearchaeota archaeon]